MVRLRLRMGMGLAAAAGFLLACGSDKGTGAGSSGAQSLVTVELQAAGPDPDPAEVFAGGRVTFANHDAVARQIISADCPDVATDRLEPGASQTLEVNQGPRKCTYSDALGAGWQGHLEIVAHPRDDGGTGGS